MTIEELEHLWVDQIDEGNIAPLSDDSIVTFQTEDADNSIKKRKSVLGTVFTAWRDFVRPV